MARTYGDQGQASSFGQFGQAAHTYGSRGGRVARAYSDQGQATGFGAFGQTYLYAPRGRRIAHAYAYGG